jgi:hypothetical protein
MSEQTVDFQSLVNDVTARRELRETVALKLVHLRHEMREQSPLDLDVFVEEFARTLREVADHAGANNGGAILQAVFGMED